MKQAILVTSIFFSLNTLALECMNEGQIKSYEGKKEVIKKDNFCYKVASYEFISKNCLLENSCKAITSYKKASGIEDSYNELGSPQARRCMIVGGKVRNIWYFNKKKIWVKQEICLFDDESYISTTNSI